MILAIKRFFRAVRKFFVKAPIEPPELGEVVKYPPDGIDALLADFDAEMARQKAREKFKEGYGE